MDSVGINASKTVLWTVQQKELKSLLEVAQRFCGYVFPVKVMYLISFYWDVFKKAED